MSQFAQYLAEHPEWVPVAEPEPQPGEQLRPGGLYVRIERHAAERVALAQRIIGR